MFSLKQKMACLFLFILLNYVHLTEYKCSSKKEVGMTVFETRDC